MRGFFCERLKELSTGSEAGRRWIYVPYDQLNDGIGPLAREPAAELGIVMIESAAKAARRPYHKSKLAHLLCNSRSFALEQAARGVAVRYVMSPDSFLPVLKREIEALGPLRMMEAAERELRAELAPLVESGELDIIPHEGWLSSREDFLKSQEGPPWRMDAFYRQVRRRSGVLMAKGKAVGGRFSFDGENRKPWKGKPAAAEPPRFEVDELRAEVGLLIEERFSRHPGRLELESVPASLADARRCWDWAKAHCLPFFGDYEDAMSSRSRTIFHSRISTLLNLHRLLPVELVCDVEALSIPLNSKEGFIRQVLGWREFVRHIHELSDGFRTSGSERDRAGDGGYENWSGEEFSSAGEGYGGVSPNYLGVSEALPASYWGVPSGLKCLDTVVESVWEEGYSHHITRLMVLSNIAALLDVSPRELADWFWVAYSDAYDWVVEPNVLGMGLYALGPLMTSKPYVSGAAYIAKMSDYCSGCRFDPKKNCPLTRMYWAYLARHEAAFAGNQRMGLILASLGKRSEEEKARDKAVYEGVWERLRRGERVV